MGGEIKRYADGNWYQGKPQETFASDQAETWSGTRDKSMEHVSDEYAKYLAMQKEWNMKEDIGKLYLQKECIDLLEENEKIRKAYNGLVGVLKVIIEKYSQCENAKKRKCLIDTAEISFIIKTIKKAIGDNNEH